jgi:ABC-2 type transport system permease protein
MNIRVSQVDRSSWIGLKTSILRECAVIVSFWSVTLAPPAITTFLYFTVFGEIIGKRIGRSGLRLIA